jgi:hypothetical protein
MTIEQEIAAYEALRVVLELHHTGQWAVVHDEALVGLYPSFDEAARDAVKRFGGGPYLIRKIGAAPFTLPASVLYRAVQDKRPVAYGEGVGRRRSLRAETKRRALAMT